MSSLTTKSGFMMGQHGAEDNIKIRFYA